MKREHDDRLDAFDRGCLELSRDGVVQGYVATTTGTFWSPGRPRTIQPCVWLVVVWADGTKERFREDYPPWTYVREIWDGRFEWEGSNHRPATDFTARWVPRDLAPETWARLGIGLDDF